MRRPSKLTSPWRSTSPMTALRVVDFPAPLRPASITTSPAWSCRLAPNSTRARPYPASTPRSSSSAKIDLLHAGVLAHGVGRPARDQLAGVEHEHAVGMAEHHIHVGLGEEDRD